VYSQCYHCNPFLDKKKATRRIEQLKKQLNQGDMNSEELEAELFEKRVELNYIIVRIITLLSAYPMKLFTALPTSREVHCSLPLRKGWRKFQRQGKGQRILDENGCETG
jgi:hypothetical protein